MFKPTVSCSESALPDPWFSRSSVTMYNRLRSSRYYFNFLVFSCSSNLWWWNLTLVNVGQRIVKMVKNGQWVVKNSQIRSTMGRKPIIVNMTNVVNPFNKNFIYFIIITIIIIIIIIFIIFIFQTCKIITPWLLPVAQIYTHGTVVTGLPDLLDGVTRPIPSELAFHAYTIAVLTK